MAELEKNVLAIEKDGLVWGEAKLEPIGFGIKKLRINRRFSFVSLLEILDANSNEQWSLRTKRFPWTSSESKFKKMNKMYNQRI